MTTAKMKMTWMTVMTATSAAEKRNEYNKVTEGVHTLSSLATSLSLV
jgi:hypothetical protein